MKLRNRILAGFAATVLALSMMVGSAMAGTKELPFEYPNEANAATNNDVWVKVTGGSAGEAISTEEIAHAIRSVDITITGKATFDAELIFNFDGGWVPTKMAGQTVDGELVLNLPMNGKGSSYCEVIVNLQNKTEGALAVSKMEFKDENGNVILTHGGEAAPAAEAAAPAADKTAAPAAAPKTGVVSSALLLGFGAVAFGSGAVALKKKEN